LASAGGHGVSARAFSFFQGEKVDFCIMYKGKTRWGTFCITPCIVIKWTWELRIEFAWLKWMIDFQFVPAPFVRLYNRLRKKSELQTD